eukprot:2494263-Amphidinium_carterae.1
MADKGKIYLCSTPKTPELLPVFRACDVLRVHGVSWDPHDWQLPFTAAFNRILIAALATAQTLKLATKLSFALFPVVLHGRDAFRCFASKFTDVC